MFQYFYCYQNISTFYHFIILSFYQPYLLFLKDGTIFYYFVSLQHIKFLINIFPQYVITYKIRILHIYFMINKIRGYFSNIRKWNIILNRITLWQNELLQDMLIDFPNASYFSIYLTFIQYIIAENVKELDLQTCILLRFIPIISNFQETKYKFDSDLR